MTSVHLFPDCHPILIGTNPQSITLELAASDKAFLYDAFVRLLSATHTISNETSVSLYVMAAKAMLRTVFLDRSANLLPYIE